MKEQQLDLFADRMSIATLFASASTLRLSPAAEAFRRLGLVGTGDDRAQVGTIRAKFLKVAVCISVCRVPLSFSSTCAGAVRPDPGEPAGGCVSADVAPFAVPAASPPKAGPVATGLVCLCTLPRGGVAVRDRECSSFIQGRGLIRPTNRGSGPLIVPKTASATWSWPLDLIRVRMFPGRGGDGCVG